MINQIIDDYKSLRIHNLQIKRPTCSANGNGYFFEIKYKKHPVYLLTPKMLSPFGLNQYGNGISLSFRDSDVDAKIQNFYQLIQDLDDFFLEKKDFLQEQISKISETIGSFCYKPSIKITAHSTFPPLMSLKIVTNKPYQTMAYDSLKNPIQFDDIQENSLVTAIIQLSGIWVRKTDESYNYGLQWNIIQMKIEPPHELVPFAIFESTNIPLQTATSVSAPLLSLSAPPPPPPPPPPLPPINYHKSSNKKTITEIIAENRAKYGDKIQGMRLERAKIDANLGVGTNNKLKVPSLYEIQDALKNLRKVEIAPNKSNTTKSQNPMDQVIDELKERLKMGNNCSPKPLRAPDLRSVALR